MSGVRKNISSGILKSWLDFREEGLVEEELSQLRGRGREFGVRLIHKNSMDNKQSYFLNLPLWNKPNLEYK